MLEHAYLQKIIDRYHIFFLESTYNFEIPAPQKDARPKHKLSNDAFHMINLYVGV